MLDLSNCNLKILPKTLFQNLTTLNYLSLTNNFLNQLPYLPDKLDYLDLSYNQFIYLNEKILKLNNLHTLHLKYNQIRSLEFLKYYYQYDDDEHINNTIDQDNYVSIINSIL
ncbi:unnamed protein product [Didymodactylos carnosus]|uniref:Leucine-rich repeat protein n=1 Tax=Didymodactylos carnosus TaxID=1234261 RepID=A0A8S2YA06_9BILA|nr:unnamed protein product [Didymodactylos carnosus]CAF4541931.1 unnamed protein product [Didymodactylos carnosus]